ncbi:GNAT family N-acetyltransferase [Spartinivicinus poritis]|uniref:GNAT family protein n=1 Tax=Spartinivicinus poritis TaxID=2994640 RepID=A0ABT5U6T8_9GAMM|nr:GNAT family protein [Spartinivicinus sp. A2-2]MDE1462079.1 GNAT family protein [Spartinivicinus sp. A2-2]
MNTNKNGFSNNNGSCWIEPATLTGDQVILEPLTMDHVPCLQKAAKDGDLWTLWFTSVPAPDQTASYVQTALAMAEQHIALPFAVRDRQSNTVVGTTRFCNIDHKNPRLEIGYTWYAKRCQRTALNTEAKLLLLTHAFEQLNVIAVEFRTHWHNQASRRAIERLGAKQDGVLRNHQQTAEGVYRDTVVFSIINSEWPAVKQHLQHKLAQYQA